MPLMVEYEDLNLFHVSLKLMLLHLYNTESAQYKKKNEPRFFFKS